MYYEFMSSETPEAHQTKLVDFIDNYEYVRYARPSPALSNYCQEYVDKAIVFVSIEIGSPIFAVFEQDIAADFITKVGALGGFSDNFLDLQT